MTIKVRKKAKDYGLLGGAHDEKDHKPDWFERKEIEQEILDWWAQQDADEEWINDMQDRMDS